MNPYSRVYSYSPWSLASCVRVAIYQSICNNSAAHPNQSESIQPKARKMDVTYTHPTTDDNLENKLFFTHYEVRCPGQRTKKASDKLFVYLHISQEEDTYLYIYIIHPSCIYTHLKLPQF